MRRLSVWIIFALLAGSVAPALAAEPEPMTPDELISIDRAREGETVLFSGEAIGEDLHADADSRWVNLLGESLAIGVYMTNDQAAQISVYGDHTHEGDRVEVLGVINIGCDQHGGEFDVHAERVKVLVEGHPVERPVAPWKSIAAISLLVIGAVELRLLQRLRDRKLT